MRHSTTGRWRLGLLLAVVTMLSWATLPVALKVALERLDPWTLTWFRFLVAAVVMIFWLGGRDLVKSFENRDPVWWALLLVAAVGLIGNYVLYLMGLDLTTPAVAQVLIQLAPLLMGLGGIVLFGERYSKPQWAGFAVLVTGLAVFFNHQLRVFASGAERLWQGAALILLAALTWAAYALAQKQLLRELSSPRIMVFIYVFAAIALFPASTAKTLLDLDLVFWAILGYCALNTLVAYGAFAESLNHWEASRVSAVLALTPLGTLVFAALVERLHPTALPPERLEWLSLAGAGLVVAGAMITSLASRRRRERLPASQQSHLEGGRPPNS